jgi:hypothetical protein
MRKMTLRLIFASMFIFLISNFGFGQDKSFKYVGAKQCKMCHNSAKKGAQFKKWSEASHAQAFAVLASAEAKKIAKEKGIADPQKSDDCLKCHVTGHGQPAGNFGPKFKVTEEGVGCEACHGPGSAYKKIKAMKDVYSGKIKGATVGLVTPDEAVCKTCHNPESPTYKEFNFAEKWKMIDHSMPAK